MIPFASAGIHGLVTGPPPRFFTDEDGDNPETEKSPGMGQGPEPLGHEVTCGDEEYLFMPGDIYF